MPTTIESQYKGRWIELTEREDEGLFLAGIRITADSPTSKSRTWQTLEPFVEVHFDFDSASEEALIQAHAYIDAGHHRAARRLSR